MVFKEGNYPNGKVVEGKRFCKSCDDFHLMNYMCPAYGLRIQNQVKKYVTELNLKMNQLNQKGRK